MDVSVTYDEISVYVYEKKNNEKYVVWNCENGTMPSRCTCIELTHQIIIKSKIEPKRIM